MTTKGRKTEPSADRIELPAQVLQTAQANAEKANELEQHSAEVALHYDDGLPYDRSRLLAECRFFMAKSGEAFCEAGKRLIVLKENEPHGEFLGLLGQLGIEKRLAQRAMQSAVKFLSPAVSAKAAAPTLLGLGQTKLIELLSETDEAIEQLADGGTVAGKTLDQIDAMTARELRAALRKTRDDVGAKDRLLEDKNKKIDKLTTEAEFRLAGPTEAQLKELASTTNACEVDLIRLAQVVGDMASSNSAPLRQRATQAVQYLVAHLADLIEENHIEVSLAEGLNVRPEWLRTLPAEPDAAAAAEPKGKKTKPAR